MAKVLTVKQLCKLSPNSVVWEEFRAHGHSCRTVKPMLVSRYDSVLYDEDGEIPIEPGIYDTFDGDKHRRFWDAKPTKAERDAAPWQQ